MINKTMTAVHLDVSQLEPPEPMRVILNALTQLTANQYLQVVHRREPIPLFTILDEQGYQWQHKKVAENQHTLWIWNNTNHT